MRALLVSGDSPSRLRLEALSVAQRVLCAEHDDADSCPVCRRVREGLHPDLFRLRPDGAQIRVEDAREAVRFAQGRPYEAPARLVWVEEAETLRDAGANALLKSLEEPGEAIQWLLTTTSPESLLATIRSRCLHRRLPAERPSEILRRFESAGLPATDARDAAAFGFEPGQGIDLDRAREERRLLLAALSEGSLSSSLAAAAWLPDRENAPRLVASLLRDAAILAAGAPPDRVRHYGAAAEIGRLAKAYREDALREAASEADGLEEAFRRSRQKRLAYERLFLRLIRRKREG